MNRDFTYKKYTEFLIAIIESGYTCITTEDYFTKQFDKNAKLFILRHDVDRLPFNAVVLAKIQKELNVKGTYYWRIHPESYNEQAIKEVVELGHELGYHYEDVTLCKGDLDKSVKHFEDTLQNFRKFYPIQTICMHGSPMSKWDNRLIWDNANYREYGIIAEPYYDFDFNEFFYLTDTGRHWNDEKISVRDKVNSEFDRTIKNTDDIIHKLKNNLLPNRLMYNIHPHRWNDGFIAWSKEIVMQNIKNQVKRFLVK